MTCCHEAPAVYWAMIKKIPYSVASYEKIVEEGYHFVDKTRFIRELENYHIPVMLRPRRFGKSLWCSILECYYDINRKDKFDALFADTDIGRSPHGAAQQAFGHALRLLENQSLSKL